MSLIWSQYTEFLNQMPLFWAVILLPVGLIILIKGADWLVDGAVAIAKQLGLSPLIIGLTIVAMGTSAPEVAASIQAALSNSPGIAVGNVYGSNIANLALVGGLCAIIRPIGVSRAAMFRDLPLMLAVALLLYPLFYNHYLSRLESTLMLALFAGIITFMVYSERKRAKYNLKLVGKQQAAVEQAAPHPPKSLLLSAGLIIIGLLFLAEGANLTVAAAKLIGKQAGLSDVVIGVTFVAVGTSLPELLTCVIAAFKGQDDLSVGNLVGSNIFNTLLVIGASGLVRPYTLSASPELTGSSYLWMIFILMLFSLLALFLRKISKPAGVLLLVCYGIYIAFNLGLLSQFG